jgi:2,3,4,5-tetrahydropyridine-2-carboxylate N-succinyltransferase
MTTPTARELIEAAFADPSRRNETDVINAVFMTIRKLDAGVLRVASPPENPAPDGSTPWEVHAWVKQAILLYFGLQPLEATELGPFAWHDRIPLKKDFRATGVRAVPPATVRFGAHIEKGAVLMPSYVNIGARVGAGTMVDTWATVGSCAQVGANVHLSGGVGLGGVLEPPAAEPVIVEDGAFIGSRCIVVEGVRIGAEAVLGAGVVLASSTRIIDVSGSQTVEYKGFVPPRAVVIPGSVPKTFPAGEFHVPVALIIGRRTESTDRKTSLNQALRDFGINA